MLKKIPSEDTWIPLLLLLLFVLSFAAMTRLELAPDEAYYWQWAKHPALSYMDHPPMVAWVIALSTALGGDTELFVRLGGFLLIWIGFAFTFLTVRKLFHGEGPRLAWQVVLALNLIPVVAGASVITTIDTPLFAFWMAFLYFGARVVIDQDHRAWYGLGLALGLGMLSKYTMALLVPGMLAFLLFSPDHRHWLLRREPWLAAILSLAVFSPVLIWNWQNDWLSFAFQLNQGFQMDTGGVVVKLAGYFGEQAGIASPLIFLMFLIYGGTGIQLALGRDGTTYRYLALLSWPVLLFFAFTSIRGEQAEANWPATAYLAGLVLAFAVYRRHFAQRRVHRAFFAITLSVSLALMLTIWIHALTQALPIPTEKDRLRELFGWKNLGTQVEQIMAKHPHAEGWFLAGDKYFRLAEADFYTGNRYTAVIFSEPQRYLYLDDPNRELKGKNAVILADNNARTLASFGQHFRKVTPIKPFQPRYKGKQTLKHRTHLLLGEEFLGNWRAFDRLKERSQ
jgi:4-amino-4-deoxy-L-arabinose transferase-like glycosyltransferase